MECRGKVQGVSLSLNTGDGGTVKGDVGAKNDVEAAWKRK